MKVEIYTPRNIIYKTTANEVILPSRKGPTSILDDHAPMFSVLEIGLVKIKSKKTNTWTPFIVNGGIAQIEFNTLWILAMEVEDFVDSIELSEALKELDDTRTALKTLIETSKIMDTSEDDDFMKYITYDEDANIPLEKAFNKVKRACARIEGLKYLSKK